MSVDALTRTLDAALATRPDAPLAVAFSGGPDSTALLHALSRLPAARAQGLRALHVDHGLHADADDWARRCTAMARTFDVPLTVLRVQVDADSGLGLEGAARQARHAALAEALAPGEWLACAHHRGDQAETLLMRLLRGSGVDGLAAMRTLRPLGPGWLWRPLLDTPREALLVHLATHGLDSIDDPANRDPRHDRSWLRQALMPLLQERWPQAEANLATSARLAAEASDLLGAEDAIALGDVATLDPRVLQLPLLRQLPAPRQRRVLRAWIASLDLPPIPAACLAQVQRELLPAAGDTDARVAWQGMRIQRWRELAHAGPERAPLPATLDLDWAGGAVLALPDGGTLALEPDPALRLPWRTRVRARQGGERLQLPGREHHASLKQLLQAHDIPTWERAQLPLLVDAADGELLAAGDLLLSARLHDWLVAQQARLRWHPPG